MVEPVIINPHPPPHIDTHTHALQHECINQNNPGGSPDLILSLSLRKILGRLGAMPAGVTGMRWKEGKQESKQASKTCDIRPNNVGRRKPKRK